MEVEGLELSTELDLKIAQKFLPNEILTNLKIIKNTSEIILSATQYTSPTVHKVFPIPSLYNDIAIVLSTGSVSFICIFLLQQIQT